MSATAAPSGFASAAEASAHVFATALDDALTVDGADGHHLVRVRRLRVGEKVTVADGSGWWRRYAVVAATRDRLDLEALDPPVVEPRLEPALTVAFGIGKGHKPEVVVTGLTELGVDRMVALVTERAVVRWDEARGAAALERLRRVAREAAQQCRRARLPEVVGPRPVDALPTDGVVVVGDPRGQAAGALDEPPGGEWLAVVGPEGGLTPAEHAALLARPGAVAVAVGPHVLRTETAALALAAALSGRRRAVRGDLPR